MEYRNHHFIKHCILRDMLKIFKVALLVGYWGMGEGEVAGEGIIDNML